MDDLATSLSQPSVRLPSEQQLMVEEAELRLRGMQQNNNPQPDMAAAMATIASLQTALNLLTDDYTAAMTDLAAADANILDLHNQLADEFAAHGHLQSEIDQLETDLNTIRTNMAKIVSITDGTALPFVTYEGCKPVIRKATVATCNAVFHFTDTLLAGGNAVFPNGPVPNSESFRAEEGVNPHAFGAATWFNGNKSLMVPVNRTGSTLTVLGLTVLGANVAANGSVVYAIAWGR